MSHATLEEAWNLPSTMVSKPDRHPRKLDYKDTSLQKEIVFGENGADEIRPKIVKRYLQEQYSMGGIDAVLRALTPQMIADIRFARSADLPFWSDPEAVTMLLMALFAVITLLDAL